MMDYIPNDRINEELEVGPGRDVVKTRQLKWFAHVFRLDTETCRRHWNMPLTTEDVKAAQEQDTSTAWTDCVRREAKISTRPGT